MPALMGSGRLDSVKSFVPGILLAGVEDMKSIFHAIYLAALSCLQVLAILHRRKLLNRVRLGILNDM